MKHHHQWITYKVPEKLHGYTVSEILRGPLLLSNRMINRLTRSRGIKLNGKATWLKRNVMEGDLLQVALRPREKADLEPHAVPFSTIYEDEDLMVVDKPAGIKLYPTLPDEKKTLAHGIVYYWREQGWEGKVRPVHRLDRNTSGLLLIAKSAYAHQLLDRELRQGAIQRNYLAVVEGNMEFNKGTLDTPIGRDPHHPIRRMAMQKGDPALTHYQVLSQGKGAALLDVRLETGRTHQIRVHLSHLGYPLLGDSLYGGSTHQIQRQALHAYHLSFFHPLLGKRITLIAPLPHDLLSLTQELGLDVPVETKQ